MKKSLVLFLVISGTMFGPLFFVFKGAISCELTGVMGYKEVQPNVFIAQDRAINVKDTQFLALGAARVAQTFGQTLANPTVILTDSAAESAKFFTSDVASSHSSPFNNCLVIGPKGQNIDVFAHELVHAEIYQRLGWFTQVLNMPKWFEEGVALFVDYRAPFLPKNIRLKPQEIVEVQQLFYGHQFYNKNAFGHYQAARLAVASVKRDQLYANLEKMRQGQSFADVFALKN